MTTPPTSTALRLVPDSATTMSGRVDTLFGFLTITSALLTLAVLVLVLAFAVRYRRRSEDEVPPESPPMRWLEISSSLGLLALFMVMFFWGVRLYIEMKRPAADALVINVVAKQWMWKIEHPGGQREIDALHVPINRPVRLMMTSQDVIHSFGLPAFRIKQDVLPGSYSTQWFTATVPGEYDLFCNEYCGTDHSQMRGKVVVMTEKDYESWLAGVPVDEPPAIAGARLFTTWGCAQCHGQNAPTLAGLYGRQVRLEDGSTVVADESYLRDSILFPSSQVVTGYGRLMPSYRQQLSEEQVAALVAYIRSLAVARTDAASPARTDVAAPPATQPSVNGTAPNDVTNVPPARQPPPARQIPAGGGAL